MRPSLPEIMLAVLLSEIDGQLTARHVPIPRPGAGEVLVKMAASPINPSDLARIRNVTDPSDRLWYVPGIEGSGTVIASGKGLLPRLWMGKRVACNSFHNTSGTWAEYMVTPASHCIPIPADISDEQGSMMLVNPMTAVAFFDIARKNRHKAIVNTAAASSLGRMIELLGKKYKIPVIHIIRNEKQKNRLIEQGFRYVLDSSAENFSNDLHSLSHQLNATLVLDAVEGKLTREILLAVPDGSSVILYGNLSGEPPEIDHRSLVMGNKKISGFFLGNHLKVTSLVKTIRYILRVRRLLRSELKITVQGRFPLEKAQQALDTYLDDMTAGKVLLIPAPDNLLS
jgi:NADPH:quinone reductase